MKSFQSKSRQRQNVAPPRIALLVEGETEDAGMPVFVRKIIADNDKGFQVLDRTNRIRNSHTKPASAIAKDINKLAGFILDKGDAEYVFCIVDFECRVENAASFYRQVNEKIERPNVVYFGLAMRSVEAWMLAEIYGLYQKFPAEFKSRPVGCANIESIGHPAEAELKKYCKSYSKTKTGIKFLQNIDPVVVAGKTDVFDLFYKKIRNIC